jgi:hypothetical protein
VLVVVCGTSVPDVWDVVDVVPAEELVEVVVGAAVVLVCDEEFDDGLLEHAARPRAQAGRRRRIDQVRNAPCIAGAYGGAIL